jgi:histidinol-phosphate aminotransferase
MGLLDYYRQFEDMDQEEVNRGLRERRAREKALELEHVPLLDLSGTEWPDLPNAEVMNASIYAARGRVNGYPDRHATRLRGLLAERHGIDPEQIVVGNGAAELLQTAAYALLAEGDELLTPWPSYPLYPLMASRAGARPVPVEAGSGRAAPEALRAAVGERTRVLVICNPNDPTGTHLSSPELGELLATLPERVHVLLDEAYVHFQDVEPQDAALRLVDDFPSLLVFRTFSKAYGLSGLRAGYVMGSKAAGRMLEALSPILGVNALTQAAVQHALEIGDAEIDRRRQMVVEQRARVLRALHDLPIDAPDSQANFVWMRAPGLTGAELAARLERERVLVAPGAPLGDEEHVRATIRGAAATERLLTALERALTARPRRGGA